MSKIEWTDATWNPVVGCSPVSEGCRNCYAAKEAIRLGGNPNPKIGALYAGTSEMRGTGSKRRAVFTGKVNMVPERLDQPLRWRKPRRVFVNSMSDLFHESVPFEFIDRVFAVMALATQHTFQILTKRPERMAEYLNGDAFGRWCEIARTLDAPHSTRNADYPLPNVWLGTSVEDQAAADERIPHLLRTPAAVRFLSCEPLIGPVDLNKGLNLGILFQDGTRWGGSKPILDWIIVGGESGPGARPCELSWIRSLVEQCQGAGVPVFVKQLGARPMTDRWDFTGREPGSIPVALRDRKGGDPAEWPEDLRVREYPVTAEEARHV